MTTRQYSSVSQKEDTPAEVQTESEDVAPPAYSTATSYPSTQTGAVAAKDRPVAIELHNVQSQIEELPSLRGQTEEQVQQQRNVSIMENKGLLYGIGAVVGVIALLLAIILPISFSTLEYHELGFVRQKTTGEINRDKAYGPGGRHLVGPDYEFRTFDADNHFETYSRISIFAADRLQVTISARMQYFLRKDQLALLHRKYDINYHTIIRNNGQDAIKNQATLFETRQFIRERDMVERELYHAVRQRLSGQCCEMGCEATGSCYPGCKRYEECKDEEGHFGFYVDVRYFQLTELDIPDNLEEQFLLGLIHDEEDEAEKYKQEAQVVRINTDAQVKQIENEAQEISQNATSQSALIGTVTRSNATATVEAARANGLKHLYSELNIVSAEHKASFDYLRTLLTHENIHIAVDYQTLVKGPA